MTPISAEATGRPSLKKCVVILSCGRTHASASDCFVEECGSLEVYLAFKKESALHRQDSLMRLSSIQIVIIS